MRLVPVLIFVVITACIRFGVMPGMNEATSLITGGVPRAPVQLPLNHYEYLPALRPTAPELLETDPTDAPPRAAHPRRPDAPAAPRMHPAERLLNAPPADAPPVPAPEVRVP